MCNWRTVKQRQADTCMFVIGRKGERCQQGYRYYYYPSKQKYLTRKYVLACARHILVLHCYIEGGRSCEGLYSALAYNVFWCDTDFSDVEDEVITLPAIPEATWKENGRNGINKLACCACEQAHKSNTFLIIKLITHWISHWIDASANGQPAPSPSANDHNRKRKSSSSSGNRKRRSKN